MADINVVCLSNWKVPFAKLALLKHIFTEKRRKTFDRIGTFQISAGEMIAAIPVVLYFIESVPLVKERLLCKWHPGGRWNS